MSRTVVEIEKEIADIKAANPGWLTDRDDKKLIAALTEEKLRLSRTLPFILFSAVFIQCISTATAPTTTFVPQGELDLKLFFFELKICPLKHHQLNKNMMLL